MGSEASKPVDSTNNLQPSSGCPVQHDGSSRSPPPATDLTASDATNDQASPSKCPMHNEDGSYSYDWWALFRPNFPHRPGGSKPLTEDQARSRITRRASIQDGAMASPAGGCPVTEYNVYSQPVDPKNNMPRMANQLPAAQQAQSLSTERVQSSIPKVGVWCRCLNVHSQLYCRQIDSNHSYSLFPVTPYQLPGRRR